MAVETATLRGVADDAAAQEKMINELAAFLGADEPPKEEPTAVTAEENETPTLEAEDGELDEETDADVMEDETAETSETVEGEEPVADRWMPDSLEDLAEALETDAEELAKLIKVKTKIEGEDGEATLADLRKSFQLEGTLNKRLEAFATERKEIEAARAAEVKALQEKWQEVDDTLNAAEKMMLSDYSSVDWSDLKENDPTEYLIQQQGLQQRYSALQNEKNRLKTERENDAKKQQEEYQKAIGPYLQEQEKMFLDKVPEWRDEKVQKAELEQVKDYFRSIGVTDQEMGNFVDHRLWVIGRSAMLYDQVQTKANPKMKKMKTKPKFVPPGARRSKQSVSEKSKKASLANAMKRQTEDAWVDAIEKALFS